MPAISEKRRQSINFANNVIIRDASGILRSKKEVIDLMLDGLDATNSGEEDSEIDGECAYVWLQTTFLTDESDVDYLHRCSWRGSKKSSK